MFKKMENTSQRQNRNMCLVNVELIIQNGQKIGGDRVFISTLLNNFRHFRKKLPIPANALYNAKNSCYDETGKSMRK